MFQPTKKSEKQDAEIARSLAETIDDLGNAGRRKNFFLLCISVNVIIWLTSVLFADYVYDGYSTVIVLSNKIAIAGLGIPFSLGLYSAYTALRMRFTDVEDNKHLGSDMMASFSYQESSTKRWTVWVISAAAGVLNVLGLVLITSYMADRI